MVEREQRQNSELLTLADRTLFYTTLENTDKQLTVRDQIVRISNTYAITVTLPSVVEAAGLQFAISVDSATAAVTLKDKGGGTFADSVDWTDPAQGALDAAEDSVVYKSDGRRWLLIEDRVSA